MSEYETIRVGPAVPHPGERIGRYSVLDTLGRGGMGIVVLAHDPELDRDVAIKLLHPKATKKLADAQRRLVREAQAMAALAHPNVIGVLDVGVWRDRVFVAMEYIEGVTLRRWAESRPSVDEVLRVYTAAGRGLGAAHRADLVHRDFKPENVMLADDGRVLVLDFGLARAAHTESNASSQPSDHGVGWSGSGNALESLTAEGQVMGTPIYMAPEQHSGSATPASDQYSFCVALFEALTGERPFVGEDVFALAVQKVQFEIRPFPARPVIPRAVKAALRRGLSPEPDERFACMEDLLAAISGRRRIDRMLVGSVLGVGVVGTLGLLAMPGAQAEPCAEAGSAAAVWGDAQRSSVRDALLATNVPYAADTASSVVTEIDARVAELAAAQQQACAATHVEHTQSEAALDIRFACLDRRVEEVSALVDVLAQADRDVVEHAVAAARKLRPASTCDDAAGLERETAPVDDKAAIDALWADVAKAVARLEAGKFQVALDQLDAARVRAAELGYAPLQAEIDRYRGDALHNLSEFDRAMEAYLAATETATRIGDDRTAAVAYTGVAWTVGHSLGRLDEARAHLRTAQALVERLGSPADLEAHVLLASGVLAFDRGEFEAARRDLEAARILEDANGGASAAVLTDLSRALHTLGRSAEAEAILKQAVAKAELDQGPAHPQVAKVLAHLGGLLLETGRMDEALAAHQRELDILTKALEPDHMLVAFALTNVAGIEIYLQRYDTARQEFERAREILKRRLGPEHPNVARVTANIGEMWRFEGDLDRAAAEHEAAIASLTASLGVDHPDTARCRNNYGSVLFGASRYEESQREYEAALESLETTLPPTHASLAYPLVGVGQNLVMRGRPVEGIEPLERALSLRAGDSSIDPFDLGDTKLWLARALWDAEGDRVRAVQLAREARQAYIDAGEERREAREDAEAWLTARGESFGERGDGA